MAQIIGNPKDEEYYKHLAENISKAFNNTYWDEQAGGYASNNQASNSFALYMGLVDENNIPRVVTNLFEDVKKHDYHLTTGNLCTKYLMEILTEYGYAEAAYKIATQTTYPGWGYMLANGATTLWERWEYATGDAMNSHNHPMMGSVDSWFYKYVLGIKPELDYPGFQKFIIRPFIIKELDFAEGELNTVKGLIKTAWKKQGNILTIDVTVPDNTTAKIFVPAKNMKNITESGKKIGKAIGVVFLHEENGLAVLEVGSGNYHFKTEI